jgi:hypothetical protein
MVNWTVVPADQVEYGNIILGLLYLHQLMHT